MILASDVFGSGANVETLLFGSLLLVDGGDLALAAVAAGDRWLASLLLGQRWLATGFDPGAGRPRGVGAAGLDALLLGLVALAIVAALSTVGALLVTALFVVPALTARLYAERMLTWQLASVALVAARGRGRPLALGQDRRAPRRDDRGRRRRRLRPRRRGAGAGAGPRRPPPRRRGDGRRRAPPRRLRRLLRRRGRESSTSSRPRPRSPTSPARSATAPSTSTRSCGRTPTRTPTNRAPATSSRASGADLVLANGDELDGWVDQVVSDSGGDAPVVDLGAVVPDRLPGETSGAEASRYDPHWWHDPRNAEAAVRAIERRFAAADPAQARLFERRAGAYLARLRALDAGIARCMASVPAARRKLVTDHDAFGYFAHRYGIDVVGAVIPSQTTEAQPSAKDLSALAELIEREGVEAIFPESSLSSKVAEAIAEQTGANSDYTLYGDTLGPDGSSGATYLTMEAANADAMVRGFTGGRRGCRLSP